MRNNGKRSKICTIVGHSDVIHSRLEVKQDSMSPFSTACERFPRNSWEILSDAEKSSLLLVVVETVFFGIIFHFWHFFAFWREKGKFHLHLPSSVSKSLLNFLN